MFTAARLAAPALLLACLAAGPRLMSAPAPAPTLAPLHASILPSSIFSALAAGVEPGFPDTAPGRCAKDFLACLADGSLETVRRFEETWASKKRLAARSIEERARGLAATRERWTGARVTSTTTKSDGDLVVFAAHRNGDQAELTFHFDPDEPGKLEFIMIAVEEGDAGRGLMSEQERADSVRAACDALRSGYVFPDVAERMARLALDNLAAGKYDDIFDERDLARRLTDDFRSISNDRHLRVRPAPRSADDAAAPAHPGGPDRAEMRQRNYAFTKVEILPGNIGYLRFDAFVDDDEARETAAGAMAFLRHCDAIIYDLRSNGGGSPAMIAFLTTYLFEARTHLNDMYDRTGALLREYWTLDEVPGQRLKPGIPAFVLISNRTFSGAEEFSYNLQNLKRATIVGETSGGGAHPVRAERVNDRLVVGVPYLRAHNPISKTNWEGTGVKPDVQVAAAEALDHAVTLAREALAAQPR